MSYVNINIYVGILRDKIYDNFLLFNELLRSDIGYHQGYLNLINVHFGTIKKLLILLV